MFSDEAPLELVPCASCGRNFSSEVIQRHSKICQKSSKPRKKFDSSQQRRVEGENMGGGAQLNKKPSRHQQNMNRNTRASEQQIKQASKSSWRQKHEEFIRTVRAARQTTVAIKEGKPLPPPPPAATNPDYIQCPHCTRRFNQNAADRHIKFCAEQKKRIGTKPSKPIANQKADAAMKARVKYKPPPLKSKSAASRATRADGDVGYDAKRSSMGPRGNGAPPSRPNGRYQQQQQQQQVKAAPPPSSGNVRRNKPPPPPPRDWDDTIDSSDSNYSYQQSRSKTGLKSAITNTNRRDVSAGRSKQQQNGSSKPPVRKVAHRSSPKQHEVEEKPARSQPYYSNVRRREANGGEAVRDTPNYGSRDDQQDDHSYSPVAGGAYTPTSHRGYDSSKYKTNNNASAGAKRSNRQAMKANYCQECGSKFPVVNAKFCCECGMRRFSLD